MLLAARTFRGNRGYGTWITSEIKVAERTKVSIVPIAAPCRQGCKAGADYRGQEEARCPG